jgi:hypothetical protein
MESLVECARCRVEMTSWSAPGSPTRYYRCPHCNRTVCSSYGEVIERGTLAVRRELPSGPRRLVPAGPTIDEERWSEVKGRADQWFARLAADEHSHAPVRHRPRVPSVPAVARMVRGRA